MSDFTLKQVQSIAEFNPSEQLKKGVLAKCVPMAKLKEFQRKITGYELKPFSGGAKFRNGDILVAKITPCLENGKTAFVDILADNEIAFGSTEFIVLRARNDTNPEFLYYFAISPDFRKRAIECMEGTSGRKRVNENTLKTLELPIPNLKTQKSIAHILSTLDQKIAINNQINTQLEQMAKTLYDYWFVQFDFPDENGKPYKSSGGEMVYNDTLKREIPKGWEVKSLWSIAKYFNGLALQKYRPKNEYDDFLPVIKIREMNEGISANTEKASTEIPKEAIINDGDILFSWSATLDVKIWTQGKGALNQHIFKVTSNQYPKSFYYFELLNYLQHFKMMAELRKTTMGHITQDHLKQAFICIPSDALLSGLDQILSPIFQKIIILKKQNQQLAQLRDFLLPMLMNGQVGVGDD